MSRGGMPRAAARGMPLFEHGVELLRLVLRFDSPADALVSRYFRSHPRLGQRDRHLLAEAAYAVLRNLRLWRRLAQTAPEGGTESRLLALGWQAPAPGGGLNPRMLEWSRNALVQPTADLPAELRYSLPDWLAEAMRQSLQSRGADGFDSLAQSLLQAAPLDLRVNTLKADRDQARALLAEQGIDASPTALSPWGLRVQGKPALQRSKAFEQGLVEVQDEGSQLLALLLAPRRGEMVVDFCAGAGGKTLALGAMMRGSGRLYAFDVSQARLDRLRPRLARSGLSNVYPVAIRSERDDRVQRLAGKIDRVLVDAPCSGTGTLRRNPDLKWRIDAQQVQRLVQQQRAILRQAAALLKPGGRLVYATCSLLDVENEQVVQDFLQDHGSFGVLDAGAWWTQQGLPGAPPPGPWLRLFPHLHGTDGFFAALLERRAA